MKRRWPITMVLFALLFAHGCADVQLPDEEAPDFGRLDWSAPWLDGGRDSGPRADAAEDGAITVRPDPSTLSLVSALSIREVSAFQTLQIPLSEPEAGSRLVPLLTHKNAIIRVLVDTEAGWVPQRVRATVDINGRQFADERLITRASDQTPESFFQVRIPAAELTTTAAIRVRLLHVGEGPDDQPGHPATWPANGTSPLGAVRSPHMKMVLVAVDHTPSGAKGRLNLGDDRVQRIRRTMLAHYPVSPDELEVVVRPGHYELTTVSPDQCSEISPEGVETFTECFPAYELLAEIDTLARSDAASPNSIYVGLFSWDPDRFDPGIGGLAGMPDRAEMLANRGGYITAIAAHPNWSSEDALLYVESYGDGQPLLSDETVAWLCEDSFHPFAGMRMTVDTLTEAEGDRAIILHEVGHALSLGHLMYSEFPNYDPDDPSLDPHFPRQYATMGRDGYDARYDLFIPSELGFDFMSYGKYSFISDYNYRALFDVLSATTPGRELYGSKSMRPPAVP